MEVACQCGSIAFKTSLNAPQAVYICHCTQCRRQSGSAFGVSAMFPRPELSSEMFEKMGQWTRQTASGLAMTCYFCKTCSSRIWHEKSGKPFVSIKGGLIHGLDFGRAVHIWTSEAVVPIPEGVERCLEEPDD